MEDGEVRAADGRPVLLPHPIVRTDAGLRRVQKARPLVQADAIRVDNAPHVRAAQLGGLQVVESADVVILPTAVRQAEASRTLRLCDIETQSRRRIPLLVRVLLAVVMDFGLWGGLCLVALVVQDGVEKVDVADGQAQDFILAQLLVRRMGWNQSPQLAEGAVDLLLTPALAAVGEHAARLSVT